MFSSVKTLENIKGLNHNAVLTPLTSLCLCEFSRGRCFRACYLHLFHSIKTGILEGVHLQPYLIHNIQSYFSHVITL